MDFFNSTYLFRRLSAVCIFQRKLSVHITSCDPPCLLKTHLWSFRMTYRSPFHKVICNNYFLPTRPVSRVFSNVLESDSVQLQVSGIRELSRTVLNMNSSTLSINRSPLRPTCYHCNGSGTNLKGNLYPENTS